MWLRSRSRGVFAPHFTFLLFCVLTLTSLNPSVSVAAHRTHEVVADRGTILATSLGTPFVRVLARGATAPDSVAVGNPSWSAAISTLHELAFVTLPDSDRVVAVDLSVPGAPVLDPSGIVVPRGCTEIISNAAGSILYVANVGASPRTEPANAWMHSVLAIDVSGWPSYSITTIETEHGPRALALSPDETHLFVGTVQGAFAGTGLGTEIAAVNGFTDPYDGGSILVYDLTTGTPQATHRIPIGSPVRGLTVLSSSVYSSQPDSSYRIYFTHVGQGAQSEAPAHGGQDIPNVVSSVLMSASHVPQSRQDAIFRHDALTEYTGQETHTDLPAVLPERIVAVPKSSRAGFAAELWITHSASGTLSRAWIDSTTGEIAGSGVTNIEFPQIDESVPPQPPGFVYSLITKSIDYDRIAPSDHVRTDDDPAPFRSRPRGVAYDSLTDSILVCTESLGTVLAFDASADTLPVTAPSPVLAGLRIDHWGPGPDKGVGAAGEGGEGNFFTFGEGFDFREVDGVPLVNNQACGTCHVDGHNDGKIRLTVRQRGNSPVNVETTAFTAVPSVADIFESEWLFFEGLHTIEDRASARDTGGDPCGYCSSNEFFLNTVELAVPFRSQPSPYAPADQTLSVEAENGRAWFDALNCSRCHSGREVQFLRTNDTRIDNTAREGPLHFDGALLSDPSQSFISSTDPTIHFDVNSFRNMTVVGTRTADQNVIVRGVNTPALAGAWNNAPYLHDGRYATLDEVLRNTWLRVSEGYRAAPRWPLPGNIPDNLFNSTEPDHLISAGSLPDLDLVDPAAGEFRIGPELAGSGGGPPPPDPNPPRAAFDFQTHRGVSPGTGDWVSVHDFLSPQDYDALLEFLSSLSRHLVPFPPGAPDVTIGAFTLSTDSTATLAWTTGSVGISRVVVNEQFSPFTTTLDTLVGPNTSFTLTVNLPSQSTWDATVTTTYNGLEASASASLTNLPLFANRSADTGYDFTGTPYASISIDYEADEDEDLFITDANGGAGLMENSPNTAQKDDVPLLTNQAQFEFPSGTPPDNNRGAVAADFDNDGDLDLFVSSRDAPKIYRNQGTSPYFVDVTDSLIAPFTTLADSSWCGAWGDYDRDGDLDLYVGRATGSADQVGGPLRDVIFRNEGNQSFTYITGLNQNPQVSTTTVTWADLTGDGNLDVFVGAGGTGQESQLLEQQLSVDPYDPFATTDHDFVENATLIPSGLAQVAGATWRDFDNDGDLDLALAGQTPGSSGSQILWNDGSGSLATATLVGNGVGAKGLASLDSDLDGRADLLLAPAVAAVQPALYANTLQSGSTVFDDRSSIAGMATSAPEDFRAILAADLAGPSHTPDGDPDVFLGRANSSSAVFYQNQASGVDLPSNHWLEVGLSSDRSNNSGGIGATVTVESDGGALVQSQIVDGGSGAGSQSAPTLLFGLGTTTQDVTVRVIWPDGSQDSTVVAAGSLDAAVTVADSHPAGLVGSSITAFALAQPGGSSDWVFEWKSTFVCDPSQTIVTIKSQSGRSCPTPAPSYPVTLTGTDSDVDVQMFADPNGPGYIHRLIWQDRPCGSLCTYTYDVEIAVKPNPSAGDKQTSGDKQFSISTCIN